MTAEEREMIELENRLTRLEMGVEQIKQNSNDRLDRIMARFDRQDRLWGIVIGGVFAVCLAVGGIYLESYLSKEDKYASRTGYPVFSEPK
jgi:peptide methionine sulfoxide reductase MsrB